MQAHLPPPPPPPPPRPPDERLAEAAGGVPSLVIGAVGLIPRGDPVLEHRGGESRPTRNAVDAAQGAGAAGGCEADRAPLGVGWVQPTSRRGKWWVAPTLRGHPVRTNSQVHRRDGGPRSRRAGNKSRSAIVARAWRPALEVTSGMIWRGEGVGFRPLARPVRVTDAFQFSFPTAGAVHGQKSAPCRTEPLLTADGCIGWTRPRVVAAVRDTWF